MIGNILLPGTGEGGGVERKYALYVESTRPKQYHIVDDGEQTGSHSAMSERS